MLEGIDFMSIVLKINVLNDIFYKTDPSTYHWVKIKYLGAIQNRPRQLFCRRDNAFSQYTSAFASAIAACQYISYLPLYIYFCWQNEIIIWKHVKRSPCGKGKRSWTPTQVSFFVISFSWKIFSSNSFNGIGQIWKNNYF